MAAPLSPTELDYQLARIHQSSSTSMIAVNIVFPLIATMFVILRMIARKTTRASWQADDSVIVTALLVTYILCIELILCAHFGMGNHLLYIAKLHPNDLMNVLKVQFSMEMTWNICSYLVKLSNILLLARLFAGPAPPHFRLCLHLVHGFLFLWTTASFFSAVFRCAPLQSFWDLSIKGNCPHTQTSRIVAAAMNLFTDVMLLILPMRPVWRLHLPVKQKLAVIGIFGVGIFCLTASVARLYHLVALSQYHSHDPIYINAAPVLWASVEPCVGIVCACLPILRPLSVNVHVQKLSSWFARSFSSRSSTEADTWWHPPPEELDNDNNVVGDIKSCGKRANPDWDFLSSGEHKLQVKEKVVNVREIGEGKPSVDITTRAFDRLSWTPERGIGAAI